MQDADGPRRGAIRKRKAAAVAALLTAGAALGLSQLSGSGHVAASSSAPQASAGSLRCPPGDLVFTMTSARTAGSGRSPSPEAAVAREIAPIYRNLPQESFHRARATSSAVELAHEPHGSRLADVVVERRGSGWSVEKFVACNSLLRQGRGLQ
jgi:hypothetical protein